MHKKFIFLLLLFLTPEASTSAMLHSKSTSNFLQLHSDQNIEICTENAQRYLIKELRKNSPEKIALVLDIDDVCIKYLFDMYKPSALKPILQLSLQASQLGIKVYYLIAKPNERLIEYINTYNQNIIYQTDQEPEQTFNWKQKQLKLIKKTYPVIILLDEQTTNLESDSISDSDEYLIIFPPED